MIRLRYSVAAALLVGASLAEAANDLPPELRNIGIDQRLGEQVPLGLTFRDHHGRTVSLGDYFRGKPVLLSLVYYRCPMLCTLELNGMLRSLRAIRTLTAGREFNVVTVSFDPNDTVERAAAKHDSYVESYGRQPAREGWVFLTGGEAQIRALAKAAGYRYEYDPKTEQFAHASAIMVLTPEGRLARYFYGVEYSSRDLRLGLIEAARNRIGTLADQILLFCFHYDPATGKYTMIVVTLLRVFGIATFLALAGFVAWALRRDYSRRRRYSEGRA